MRQASPRDPAADALARFRPYVRLEPSAATVNMVNGLDVTWEFVTGARERLLWTERSLPLHFRRELAWTPGLAAHAILDPRALPPRLRSPSWRRFLALLDGAADLAPRRRIGLAKLAGMLGFYAECRRLVELGGPPGSRTWNEEDSQRAFLSMNARGMIAEDAFGRDYAEMALIAERAAPGTPIRFYAAIKYMVYCLENGVVDRQVGRCDRIAAETLRALRGRVELFELKALESKWRRARGYLPFMSRDLPGVRRSLALARERALECLELAPPYARAFAEENLYAVGQTLGVSELRSGGPREARRTLSEMKRRDPGGAWQRHWLGMAHAALGDDEAARAELLEARRLGPPGRERVCSELARCCERLGRKAEARRWSAESARVREELRRHPGDPVARRAPRAAAPEGPSAAAPVAERAQVRARALAAERLLLSGGLFAGWKTLCAALDLDPHAAAVYGALGTRAEAEGAAPRAAPTERLLAALDRRLSRGGARGPALAWRGLLRWRLGDRAGAIYDLSQAGRLRAPTLLVLAECELRTHNRRCLERLARVLARAPAHPKALELAREAVRVFGLPIGPGAPSRGRA